MPFESLRDEPIAVVSEVCEYLGISQAMPRGVGRQINAYFTVRSLRLREYVKRSNLPKRVRNIVARLNHVEAAYEPMAEPIRRRLHAHFVDDGSASTDSRRGRAIRGA